MSFKWKKLGQIFDPRAIKGTSWMQEFAQAPSVVVFDKYVRVYFSSRGLPDEKGQYISRLSFVDLDPRDLRQVIHICERPILPLGDLGTFDEFGAYPASVIKVGEEVRVYYSGWTRCESVPFNASIGLAISQDGGETFEKTGSGPILSFSPDEPFVLGSPKVRRFNDVWYLWYTSGRKWVTTDSRPEPVYRIRMAHSLDGFHWQKQGKDLLETVLEENECQASPDVFYHRGTYHMFFCYRYNLGFKSEGRGYRMGYASSADLLTWVRDDSKVGLGPSESGWDSKSVSYAHVFAMGEDVFALYQGNEMGREGFGLAKMDSFQE